MGSAGGSDFTLQIFKSSLCDTQAVKKGLAGNVRENQQIPFAEGKTGLVVCRWLLRRGRQQGYKLWNRISKVSLQLNLPVSYSYREGGVCVCGGCLDEKWKICLFCGGETLCASGKSHV